MNLVRYEYGNLFQYEVWDEKRWRFSSGTKDFVDFHAYDTLLICLDRLGSAGWKLSVQQDENDFLLMREIRESADSLSDY